MRTESFTRHLSRILTALICVSLILVIPVTGNGGQSFASQEYPLDDAQDFTGDDLHDYPEDYMQTYTDDYFDDYLDDDTGSDPGSEEPIDEPEPEPEFPSPGAMTAKLVTNPYIIPTHERMMKDMQKLKEQYPILVDFEIIGKTASGVEIPAITLGVGPKKVLIVGSMHAREYVTVSQIMRSVDSYAYAYAKGNKIAGIDVRKVLNEKVTYCFVPMMNPDGVAIASGRANAKQRSLAIKAVGKRSYNKYRRIWKGNARSVNLNRNFPFRWNDQARQTKKRSYDMYRGPYSESEAETKAIIKLCKANDFKFMISCHTKGYSIWWDDHFTGKIKGAVELSKAINGITRYPRCTPVRYLNGGHLETWFRYKYKKPGIVIEFTPYSQSYHTANRNFDRVIWSRTKSLWLQLYPYAK